MKERINVLASGIAEQILPVPVLSHNRIEEEIRAGIPVKGEFSIFSGNEAELKGLVYSGNYRVKVSEHAFVGKKCRIRYSVDTEFLDTEVKLEGSFCLITNGGELELPFSFSCGCEGSKSSGGLERLQDFAELAASDMDAALRLFEYNEFKGFPFMQDTTLRAVYDSFRGKGERLHSLEEFLIAMAVKDPVIIEIEKKELSFQYDEEREPQFITIEKNTWGYLRAEVISDAEFLAVEQSVITAEDFNGNRYDFPFRIDYGKLHSGRNYGTLKFSTPSQEISVNFMVLEKAVDGLNTQKNFRHTYKRYLELRLDYENDSYQEHLTLGRMQTELEYLMQIRQTSLTALLLAEVLILNRMYDRAVILLEEYKGAVSEHRAEFFEEYCFHQYLMSMIPGNEVDRESLLRLLHKYNEEEPDRFYLFLILLKMKPELFDNKTILLLRMQELYQNGCSSPFLYLRACELFNEEPHLLRTLGSFELQVLFFGVKRGMVKEETALKAAELSSLEKGYRKIYIRILKGLYSKFPKKEILEGICSILIKGNCRSKDLFFWFQKGVAEELRLIRLFEYYLYTLPLDYEKPLPMELFLYFSYSHMLDCESREKLYCNLLTHTEAGSPIFEAYERQIEEFALSCLFEGRINDRMALIYSKIIYKELIDEKIARVFPELLCSFRIQCEQPSIRYVVVRYEELKIERVIPMDRGIAYVPMYVEDCILLFQDAYGSRYYEVDYKIARLMNEPELERCCFEIYPEHTMLEIKLCREIINLDIINPDQADKLKRILKKEILNELYASKLISRLIQFYGTWDKEQADSFLIEIDKSALAAKDRLLVCESLIHQGHYRSAYDMVLLYGYEGLSSSRMLRMTAKMILEHLFEEDEILLSLSIELFRRGMQDPVVLDYLCEHFSGTAKEMYQILSCALESHRETYQMEERLLVQILFTGNIKNLDEVFSLYSKKPDMKNSIVKAYLTVKCSLYIKEDMFLSHDVFSILEREVRNCRDCEDCPVIWQLSVLKYYSVQPDLDKEQRAECQNISDNLVKQKLIFAFMQKLGRFIYLPSEISDMIMIEYKGTKSSDLAIRIRILPEQQTFHAEGMRHMYEGVFLKQILLFDGETLEYEILERTKDGIQMVDSGKRTNQELFLRGREDDSGSRFWSLNDISLCIDMGEDMELWDKMSRYMIMDEITEKLFG